MALPPSKESIELALVETNDITATPITETEFQPRKPFKDKSEDDN